MLTQTYMYKYIMKTNFQHEEVDKHDISGNITNNLFILFDWCFTEYSKIFYLYDKGKKLWQEETGHL